MRLKLISCKVLYREISLLTANSPHFVDTTFLKQGLHETPSLLNKALQDEIDKIDQGIDLYSAVNQPFDAILLGYGLCSNGISGVSSKRYRLVVPRAHDCITLFLGSGAVYNKIFNSFHGIYWYTRGWIENTQMPGENRFLETKKRYVQQYGEENAEFLMEAEQGWLREYSTAIFIDWHELDTYEQQLYTQKCAKFLQWNYDCVRGSSSLLKNFLSGQWDEESFLVVPPGEKIEPSFTDGIIKSSRL